MSKLLDQLNQEQRKVVEDTEGKMLVLAAAGSGKTRALTYRIAYIIEQGLASPQNILAVTFTNKAANEMKSRISKLVDTKGTWWIGTFHGICLRLLILYGKHINLDTNFTILDENDQIKEMSNILANYDNKSIDPEEVLKTISWAKNNFITPDELSQDYAKYNIFKEVAEYYSIYQDRLKQMNTLDFEDIIYKTLELLTKVPEIKKRLQEQFKYILSDESQDLNFIQYQLIMELSSKHNNIMMIGDMDQCWYSHSTIRTENGETLIKDLKIGNKVESFKKQIMSYESVTNITKHTANTLKIKTKTGKELIVTNNHLCFATQPSFEDNSYYVYMMYKKDKGFRVGITSGGKTKSVFARAHTEHPDRLWFIKKFNNLNEAALFEQYISLKYQVPTNPFYHSNRNIALGQKELDKVFELFGQNGYDIISDFNLDFNYPNYSPQNHNKGNFSRKIIYITSGSKKTLAEVSIEYESTRIRKWFSNYKEAYLYAKELSKIHEADMIKERLCINKEYLSTVPASQLTKTMRIPIYDQDRFILDEIVSIEDFGEQDVYDIEVASVGNMIVNDVLSHNCIYSWRGAEMKLVMQFSKLPSVKVLKLETNHRSSGNIVNASSTIIKKNKKRIDKNVIAYKETGDQIVYYTGESEYDEASFVAGVIDYCCNRQDTATYKDFAILYRTHSLSRIIEEQLRRNFIPYSIYGGMSFYDKKEIKDTISYLKLVINNKDIISFQRVVNEPKRGIGASTLQKIVDLAIVEGLSINDIPKHLDKIPRMSKKSKEELINLINIINEYSLKIDKLSPERFIKNYMTDVGYIQMLHNNGEEDRELNIDELSTMAENWNQTHDKEEQIKDMADFIRQIILITSVDELSAGDNVVKLLTSHSSKGLEFKYVFIVGMEENIFPMYAKDSSGRDEEEERRLFYVSMTRAEDKLYLTNARSRRLYGNEARFNKPSRFINEIPKNFIKRV